MLLLDDDVVGREVDLGSVTIDSAAIEAYMRSVGDPRLDESAAGVAAVEAPLTFCLSLYGGMTPRVELRDDTFAMYGGHDIEAHRPIRAGDVLQIRARITDVYEKSGRSGSLTIVVRQVSMRDGEAAEVVRVVERQIIRLRRDLSGPAE